MNLVFFLKIFADLCYYGMFAAFFASSYGLTGSLLPQFALLALAAAFSRMADRKRPDLPLRFLPLLLCPAAFLVPTQTAGLVILAPAALYVIFCCVTRRTQPDYFSVADSFFLELKLLIFPALMALALVQISRAERFALPYLLVFGLGSVLLLRMLRHDEATLSQPRFRVMNSLSVAGLCLLCGIMGSPFFRSLLGTVLKAAWKVVSFPIFLVLGSAGALLAWFLESVLPDEPLHEPTKPDPLEYLVGQEELLPEDLLEQAAEPNRTVQTLIVILLIALAAAAVFLLFRKLMASRRGASSAQLQTNRFSLGDAPQPSRPLNRLNARTPQLQVRYWYQKLLHRARDEGASLRPDMDTRQQSGVEQDVFAQNHPEITRMRQLYLPARYKNHATPEDAKEAKALFQQIKKS